MHNRHVAGQTSVRGQRHHFPFCIVAESWQEGGLGGEGSDPLDIGYFLLFNEWVVVGVNGKFIERLFGIGFPLLWN